MKKYNVKTKQFEQYDLDPALNIPVATAPYKEIINCACCLKELTYDDSYYSEMIFTELDTPLSICFDCVEKENEELRNAYK